MEPDGERAGERVSWQRLKERILARDGHRCRNCTSDKYLEVHHWQPFAEECHGIDVKGYSTGSDPRIVPESGLVTLCQVCHNALTEARKVVRLSEDSSRLGPVSVPQRDWHNIFELWALNDRQLPMKVVRESWNQTTDHYMLVERIEIRRWPYGFAWGRYCRNGEAAEQQKNRIGRFVPMEKVVMTSPTARSPLAVPAALFPVLAALLRLPNLLPGPVGQTDALRVTNVPRCRVRDAS